MNRKPAGSLLQTASLISAAYVFSRVLGYLREALLAARFGATHTTDAYLLAQDLPAGLFTAVTAALFLVFIPIYQGVRERQGPEAAARLTNTVFNGTGLVALLVLAGLWLVAPVLVPGLAPGLPAGAQALAVQLTRIMLPMMPFLGAAGVAAAALNANRHFTAPSLLGLASNVFVIGALLAVTQPDQISWVAYGVVAGAMAGLALQLPVLPRVGIPYRLILNLHDPALKRTAIAVLPVVVATLSQQAQQYVDRYMASSLAEGSISALNYATRLNSLPYGVVGVAIATVLYPSLAELAAAGRQAELGQAITGGLRILAYVLLPMALGMFVFRHEIVQLFFQRGAFDARATWVTAYALQYYALGILFFGWLDFVYRCFFALQDFVTPMWSALLMVVVNLLLNLALVQTLQQGGLALGTSLSTALAVLVLVWLLRRRLGTVAWATIARSALFSLGAALAAAVAARQVYDQITGALPGTDMAAQAVRLAAGLAVIALVHAGLSLLLARRDTTDIFGLIKQGRRS